MHGIGTASGAVTMVNALPTGVGCAVAVTLPVRAEIDLRPAPDLGVHRLQLERAIDTPLVRETLQAGLLRFAPGKTFSGELRVESSVPMRKGLKSSSAVGGAVLHALANALHQTRSDDELARVAADVAQEIGLSATGAFDDCLAALRGGVVVSDNVRRTALRAPPFDLGLRVLLWIPSGEHDPSSSWLERFRGETEMGRAAAAAARAGRWAEAMRLNTEVVERVMGYEYRAIRTSLLEHGAQMAGVSGMGPTLAAFVPAGVEEAVSSQLPADRGEVRWVRIRGDGARLEGP